MPPTFFSPEPIRFLLEAALLTGAYAVVDALVRGNGFIRMFDRLGVGGMRAACTLWLIPCGVAAAFWNWSHVPQGDALRVLATVLTAGLAWQATTRDRDLIDGEWHTWQRAAVVLAAVASWFTPAGILAGMFLFTTPFGLWQHHATLPMRLLQSIAAFVLAAALLRLPLPMFDALALLRNSTAIVFFMTTMVASHYLITALAKMWLGPKPWSWVTENRMHHLAASAWSWGWARFIPWARWLRVIRALKRVERPLQGGAFGVELLAPLALLHPNLAVGFLLAWAAFHVGVFATSGLLFWDWIAADLALAVCILLLPDEVTTAAFGPWQTLAGLAFMAAFPLRHKLWKPMPLGWYDTPLTQRMHWRVIGADGSVRGLYNDFLCPHERIYGKVHGCFLAPVPVMTYHLGEVWKPALRDAIRAAVPDPARLDAVRARFGIRPVCTERTATHAACLRRFAAAVNAGERKHALPRGLRWLKAPGDQLFYWGDLPPWRGPEAGHAPAARIEVVFREECFDGERLVRLRDEVVLTVDVNDPVPTPDGLREPTPKELDDFLLSHAAGRLIDLPGFGDGYVKGDDGKRQET